MVMNSTSAIIDARAPHEAIEKLREHGDVFLFRSYDVTYDAVSCHPDVFIFQSAQGLVVAPNTPPDCLEFLTGRGIIFLFGQSLVGNELGNTTQYNCIATRTHFFHKQGYTDEVVVGLNTRPLVSLPQAYTRCSMFAVDDRSFITSDKGIERVLVNHGFSCFYCDPSPIVLPPSRYGFIGGCMGMKDNILFVTGSLQSLDKGNELREFILRRGISIVELSNGKLYDGGGIFFV